MWGKQLGEVYTPEENLVVNEVPRVVWEEVRVWRRRKRKRRGACLSFFCICVYSTSVVHLDSIYASRVFLNRPCMFQSFSPSFFFFITLLLQCMSLSLYPAFLHMCLSPSLSPSAAPQGRLLNAAICLCLPSLPCLPPFFSPSSLLSAFLSGSPLMNHSANRCT